MARILIDEHWFDPLSSRSVLESEYENSVRRYASNLFPGYFCCRFNARVTSEEGISQPDLALIDAEYRGWVVVEVELEHHPLESHVEPQMRRLVNGDYTLDHADYLLSQNPDLDRERLRRLIRTCEPEFLVVVPEEIADWRSTLSNLGVKLGVVKVFADYRGRRVVSQAGDLPRSWGHGELTRLTRVEFLPRAFRVETPSALPLSDTLTVKYQGFLTTWRVVRAQVATHILPNRSFDLEIGRSFVLKKNIDNSLEIEAVN